MDLETKNDYIQTDVCGLKDAEAVSGYHRVKNTNRRDEGRCLSSHVS